jgi:hypothetical protein
VYATLVPVTVCDTALAKSAAIASSIVYSVAWLTELHVIEYGTPIEAVAGPLSCGAAGVVHGGGSSVTVTFDFDVDPDSIDAVICAVPAATAVTVTDAVFCPHRS